MYTVCPECKTAFRLNAKILKQAHGRVRCGGCSSTFNAIDHLAEDLPDDEPGNTQTAHAFDERSQALLHTLDQLTGPDAVRIEDTGVEWRVLDVDNDSGNDGDTDSDDIDSMDREPPGTAQWSLEEANVEWPDEHDGTAAYSAYAAVELDAGEAPEHNNSGQQLAYSDDVGIEEDEDGGDAEIASDSTDDEVGLPGPAAPSDETAEPRQDLRYDDNTPLPDEFFRPSDDFPAESNAADHEPDEPAMPADFEVDETPTLAGEDVPPDLTFGDIDEWQDLLSEVATDENSDASSDDAPDYDRGDDDDTVLQDLNEADGDGDGNNQAADSEASEADDLPQEQADADTHSADAATDPDDELIVSEFAPDPAAPRRELNTETAAEEAEQAIAEHPPAADDEPVDDDHAADAIDGERTDDALTTGSSHDAAAGDTPDTDSTHVKTAQDDRTIDSPADTLASDASSSDVQSTAAQTDADRSVEMEIDQELLRAATLNATDDPADSQDGHRDADENMLVETIIMEGDTVTDLIGDTELHFTTELLDTGPEADEQALDEAAATMATNRRRRNFSIAAALTLSLLLAAQLLHANRATLATSPLFERTLAPVYRAIGQPVTPAWDVRGWRFESTTGSTDNADQRLTINSRIANKSTQALPYPLVYVSLTDRFEEIVGSRILRPDEYLAGNVSYRKPVAPDSDFNAVITIDSPAPEATGFKLNVCYRTGTQQLRCAIEDFLN